MAATAGETVELTDGTKLVVQHLDSDEDTATFEIEPADDDDRRRWRIEISRYGGYEVLEAFDGGEQTDSDEPGWFHELADRAV